MRLNLLYVHSTVLGYARYGVKLSDALTRMGVKVTDHLDPVDTDPANVACWVSTPTHAQGWFAGQHTVLSTMWEAAVLPEAFREGLHNFDQIVVPSTQNLELFSRYHDNVVQVPLGIDTREWAYRKRTAPTDRFVFLIGGSGSRKGTDLAYKAFKKLWPTEGSWPREAPRPTLIFKSPRPIDWFGPRIEHIGGHISDQAERDLYAMAHCYLQPSRGEGWGLQPMQAIAQGCPTILTDAHGQAEFAHLGYGLSWKWAKSDYFIYGDAGDWWEPSLDDLCEYMEYVYSNYDEACGFAEQASKVAHEQFSWESCAERFVEAIGRDRLDAPYTGDLSWKKQEMKRYLVRVNRPWTADIAGTMYHFYPARDYWENSDVKRILFESGILDPSCIVAHPDGPLTEIETGLAPQQLEKFGDYSAAMSYCHHCGQKLNSGELWQPPDDDDEVATYGRMMENLR